MFHAAYVTDDNYILPTRVSISSLARNAGVAEITVHVIASGVSPANAAALTALQTGNVRVVIHAADASLASIPAEHAYVSRAALQKFLLPSLVPDTDKLLYLDGDTLLLPDFPKIFDTNIKDVYAAVVADMIVMRRLSRHKFLGIEKYFNSGVMLLNLAKMRRDGITEQLIEHKRNFPEKMFMDQDTLNAVFGSKVAYLPLRFNCLDCYTAVFSRDEILAFFNVAEQDLSHPAIRHLAGVEKPWKSYRAESCEDWAAYLPPDAFFAVHKSHLLSLEKELRDDMAARFHQLEEKIAATDADLAGIRDEMSNIKNDIADIRGNITNIKGDIAGLGNDIANIRSDVAGTRSIVAAVQGDAAAVRGDAAATRDESLAAKGEIAAIRDELANMKSEIAALKKPFAPRNEK